MMYTVEFSLFKEKFRINSVEANSIDEAKQTVINSIPKNIKFSNVFERGKEGAIPYTDTELDNLTSLFGINNPFKKC